MASKPKAQPAPAPALFAPIVMKNLGVSPKKAKGATPIADFARTVREEPYFYIFPRENRIFLTRGDVPKAEVTAWVRQRYVEKKNRKTAGLYKVNCYKAADGESYVHSLLLVEITPEDREFIDKNWGFSLVPPKRERFRKPRLTREERRHLNAILAATEQDFFDMIERRRRLNAIAETGLPLAETSEPQG